jgi:ABC-type transporter Mla subunit MlaD
VLAQDAHLARKVGTVSLVVIGLAIAFFVFVYDRIEWGSHVRVRVKFHATAGLAEGAPFVVAGRTVGRVESIALAPHDGVIVTIAIDADVVPKLDHGGDVFIASRGALSGKYIELGPAPEPTRPLHEGDELEGHEPPSLDRVIERTWNNLTTLGKFADEIKPELDGLRAEIDRLRAQFGTTADALPNAERLGELIGDASDVAAQIRQLREVGLGGQAGSDRLAAVIARGQQFAGDARATFGKLGTAASTLSQSIEGLRGRLGTKGDEAIAKAELALDRIRAAVDKIDPLLAQIDALNASLAAGNGSMMKLMNDPEFPEDAKELGKMLKRHPWRVLDHP